ncbi:maleylpyruvate isomerase N-terminal domain-containing protein [Streptomyces sp. ODS28]|uniref:maleylpyruvate isomerase N-terminal domain-containing protein n=1 Tax=Streptomyces sp. ODS28 TaxID=3136688 RepID=UPI0031E9D916
MTQAVPGTLSHDEYCTELAEQARLFRAAVRGADLSVRVPTCPDWTLGDLVRHLGGAYRWVGETVRTRAKEQVADEDVPGFSGPGDEAGAEALDAWFAESADLLVGELRATGPEAPVWTWSADHTAGFWARRATHETVVHRADACAAAGVEYEVAPAVAADCLDEWLEIVSSPLTWEFKPTLHSLTSRAGDTLHLHATDAPEALVAEWVIELGSSGVSWRRAHAKSTVAVRGPLTDLLRVLLRRLPPTSPRVDVLGDTGLLDFWLDNVSFE